MILSGGMTIAGGTSIVTPPAAPTYTYKWFMGETTSYGRSGNIIADSFTTRANNQIAWALPLKLEDIVTGTQISSQGANILANAIITGTVIDLFGTGGNFVETVTVTSTARVIPNWDGFGGTYLVANLSSSVSGGVNANVYFKSNIATINWTI